MAARQLAVCRRMNAFTHFLISSDFSMPGSVSTTAFAKSWSSIVSVFRTGNLVGRIAQLARVGKADLWEIPTDIKFCLRSTKYFQRQPLLPAGLTNKEKPPESASWYAFMFGFAFFCCNASERCSGVLDQSSTVSQLQKKTSPSTPHKSVDFQKRR